MPLILDFLSFIVHQQSGSQQLERRLEPSAVMEAPESVLQYDRVMTTKLAVAYAAGLTVVHRSRPEGLNGHAVDLACGPGHYTLSLARYLGYQQITGIDLSSGMVETASKNAERQGMKNRVHFMVGDATRLDAIETGTVDLASFTGAAHHLPDLQTVKQVLCEMDRVTRPEGLVMVMDLARLRTEKLTERYVNLVGADYVQRGLPDFFRDFRDSMYAAWTVPELRQAIPDETKRYWCQLAPRGLPTIQIILGLPVGRKKPFLRSGVPWSEDKNPVALDMRQEWNLVRWSLFWGTSRLIAPKN